MVFTTLVFFAPTQRVKRCCNPGSKKSARYTKNAWPGLSQYAPSLMPLTLKQAIPVTRIVEHLEYTHLQCVPPGYNADFPKMILTPRGKP